MGQTKQAHRGIQPLDCQATTRAMAGLHLLQPLPSAPQVHPVLLGLPLGHTALKGFLADWLLEASFLSQLSGLEGYKPQRSSEFLHTA